MPHLFKRCSSVEQERIGRREPVLEKQFPQLRQQGIEASRRTTAGQDALDLRHCYPKCQFASPSVHMGEHEHRDVRTGDQQHTAHCCHQHKHSRTNVACQVVAQ